MDKSLYAMRPKLAAEWSEKNLPLTPKDISYGSNKVVWWKGLCGHEWQTSVKARSHGENCPFCSGARVLSGFNDLATKFPEIASEWSPENGLLQPTMVMAGSHRKVLWRCKRGHEWSASIKSRTVNGTGCPYCSNNAVLPGYNDLASRFPEIAAEWSEKNLPLTPQEVTSACNRKAWWRGKCGHEWYALISSRSAGHGCPYCNDHKVLAGFNDFATLHPELAEEWSEKNGSTKPSELPENKDGLFWWKCKTCGGEYRAMLASRTKGTSCLYCSGRRVQAGLNDLATTDPELAAEWDYELNGEITPKEVFRTSKKLYWWKCKQGHSWKAKVSERTVDKIPCRVCEERFLRVLPKLLVLLYAKQEDERVLFGSEELSGLPLEIYLPEMRIAIEKQTDNRLSREQRVKKHICEANGVAFYSYYDFGTDEDVVRFIREVFRKNHIYFRNDGKEDICICRDTYDRMMEKHNKNDGDFAK